MHLHQKIGATGQDADIAGLGGDQSDRGVQ